MAGTQFDVLIGEWTIEALRPETSADPITGRQRFEWILGGQFVLQRSTTEHPEMPDVTAILAPDSWHYFDSRGVVRLYQLSLTDGVWRIWREDPDFWQQFTGTISPDGTRIDAAWEMSRDHGSTWNHDFAMTYTKVS
jgi:hypothetical protein